MDSFTVMKKIAFWISATLSIHILNGISIKVCQEQVHCKRNGGVRELLYDKMNNREQIQDEAF
jgi:hypothetical protein